MGEQITKKLSPQEITSFIAKNIPDFHQKRLQSLSGLKLKRILKRKNPYLFKAKNIETAESLVRQLLDAHLSSQEETVFGGFLEDVAIFVCQRTFGGRKSSTEGIDLEFDRQKTRHLVSIKSEPNWGNSGQIKKMRDNFRQARKILGARKHVIAINGCCYGQGSHDYGDYQKICGQTFWELVSGNDRMYLEIIEPLGHEARKRNDEFNEEYAKVINRFTAEFVSDFCGKDGGVDWDKLVVFNSAAKG